MLLVCNEVYIHYEQKIITFALGYVKPLFSIVITTAIMFNIFISCSLGLDRIIVLLEDFSR